MEERLLERRVADKKKGDGLIKQLKFVVGCTLIGSVIAGALFGWLAIPFDVRVIGAGVGAVAGFTANHLA